MKKITTVCFIMIAVILGACGEAETGSGKDVNPEAVYFEYTIRGEEGGEDATCMIQYRFGGKNGTTLVLDTPSKVTLDGKQLPLDSSTVTGAYYEAVQPLHTFTGPHTIVFTDINGKEYREEFEFRPFELAEELPQQISRKPFSIRLKNFPDSYKTLRLTLTDTAFQTADFNALVPVSSGEIKIDAAMLANLKKGPLSVEFFSEEERPVKQATKEGGRIGVYYGFRRETELVD